MKGNFHADKEAKPFLNPSEWYKYYPEVITDTYARTKFWFIDLLCLHRRFLVVCQQWCHENLIQIWLNKPMHVYAVKFVVLYNTYLLMFSIILNCPPDVLIFGTDPGRILLMTWQRTVPSLMTSSYSSPGGNLAPKMASIHSWASLSCCGSRLDASCRKTLGFQ